MLAGHLLMYLVNIWNRLVGVLNSFSHSYPHQPAPIPRYQELVLWYFSYRTAHQNIQHRIKVSTYSDLLFVLGFTVQFRL